MMGLQTWEIWMWAAFHVVIAIMLAIDLGVFHKQAHEVSLREATIWSIVWIGVALVFNAWIWFVGGVEPALAFLTAYLVEKSLSADNIFVFAVIFAYFGVPPKYQHRVLFWGILGAIFTRAVFIIAGVQLLKMFKFTIYIFGALLLYTGYRLLRRSEEEVDPGRNPVLRLARRWLPVTESFHGQKFVVRTEGKWLATPLLLVLLVVESTDVMFAVDSVPAVLAITSDVFIAYTSNIFAILGLRALYFLLAGLLQRWRYLHTGLAVILMFIGVKMLLSEVYHIPTAVSLGVVLAILTLSAVASWWVERHPKPEVPHPGASDR